MSIQIAKKTLRLELKNKLRNMIPEERQSQSNIIVSKFLKSTKYLNSHRISVYLSRDIEVDTFAILDDIFKCEKECYIPKYDQNTTVMKMIRINSIEEFQKLPTTSWKIKQPAEDKIDHVDAMSLGGLDLMIVPGIGFTRDGYRIGNGKGYYDVYLNKYKEVLGKNVPTVALAFQEQIVPSLPTDEHDVKIDEVLFSLKDS